jgi:glucosamine--fructose-6-phosphate aminotransferase (isomerizing)
MCGIIGCTLGSGSAPGLLVEALKRLEYRGYDSAGVSVLEGGEVRTVRQVGKIRELQGALERTPLEGAVGIGHTRWATHGRPSEENAHPHRDAEGQLCVVHNGIIENWLEIRAALEADGVTFRSETDSEVIAHLVAHHYEGNLLRAVQKASARLEGSYAIAVLHRAHPGEIVAARHDSPLVLGLGEGANYLASDVAALLPLTKRVVYLEDGQIAEIGAAGVRVLDRDGSEAPVEAVEVSWDAEQAEKGGYPHFMLKEIHEQPTTISDALLGRFTDGDTEVALEEIGLDEAAIADLQRVEILACGTSWHAGHVAKFYLERFAGLPVEVDYASEFIYRDPVLRGHSLVVGISQSGETADTRAAMRRARQEFDAHAVCVCNVAGSSMVREADGAILTHAGPEIGVASTKAFMGQLTALLLLAVRLGRARGRVSKDAVVELARELRALPARIEEMLKGWPERIHPIADAWCEARDFLYIGRGINYPIALEGALKLKEISYIHAEGYPAGEMKHGPIALIDEGMPILALATEGRSYATIAGNIEEARARGGKIIAVVTEGDERVARSATHTISVPRASEWISPMINIVPLQLLAYQIAVKRGADVDQPRNLAKTVTVQ